MRRAFTSLGLEDLTGRAQERDERNRRGRDVVLKTERRLASPTRSSNRCTQPSVVLGSVTMPAKGSRG